MRKWHDTGSCIGLQSDTRKPRQRYPPSASTRGGGKRGVGRGAAAAAQGGRVRAPPGEVPEGSAGRGGAGDDGEGGLREDGGYRGQLFSSVRLRLRLRLWLWLRFDFGYRFGFGFGFGSVRFGSVWFGLVRFGSVLGAVGQSQASRVESVARAPYWTVRSDPVWSLSGFVYACGSCRLKRYCRASILRTLCEHLVTRGGLL